SPSRDREWSRAAPDTSPPARRGPCAAWGAPPRATPPRRRRQGSAGGAEARRGSRQHLRLDREYWRQVAHDRRPLAASVRRRVDLAAGGAAIYSAGGETVDGDRVGHHHHLPVAPPD